MDMRIIFWLEAGVKERGGCTPSQILFPLSNMLTEVFYLVEFERETEGVSISWQPNANGTSHLRTYPARCMIGINWERVKPDG
jgi:hypothetical protein